MTTTAATPAPTGRAAPGPWAVALSGAAALAVAMGIGRFAFTPVLPMMLADGVVDLRGASWLASANYLGYLVGAVYCTFEPWLRARWRPDARPVDGPRRVRAGLVATGVLTLGMALPWPASWTALRFGAGVASALVLVDASGWCLAQLARRHAAALGGAMFAGPGAGIVASGLCASAMVAWHWRASSAWLLLGLLAFVLAAPVWYILRSGADDVPAPGGARPAADAPAHAAARAHGRTEIACLAFAYGLAGFGYIVTATFLPVIAREALPGSPWLDFFWPIFGVGAFVGALLATRLRVAGDLRLLLASAYFIQALGIAASLWSPSLAGFVVGSLLLGLPVTVIAFLALQEVRRLMPAHSASGIGLLTVLYGIGQIVGPPLVAALLGRSATAAAGFTWSLEVAAGALAAGAAIYLWMSRAFPMTRPE
ncbi:MAG: YbfB/YjiJ family MFS transporter [Caldimonas sp.]